MVELKAIKIHVPLFRSNTAVAFTGWWTQFKSYAAQKGFRPILKAEKHSDLPEKEYVADNKGKEVDQDLTDDQKTALLMNEIAVAAFIYAFKDNPKQDCMNIVLSTQTDDWPTGQTWTIVKELIDEYIPQDIMGLVEQRNELDRIHIKKWEDPKELFSQILAIENKYRGRCEPLTDIDKLCAIMQKAPSQYTLLIQQLRARCREATNDKRAEPTLKQVKKEMVALHAQDKAKHKLKREGTELAFYNGEDDSDEENKPVVRPKAKGSSNNEKRCYHCGQKGHIKRDCPKLRGKNSGKPRVCPHCGKKGHGESECWLKHPEKKPNWLKAKERLDRDDEVAGVVIDCELAFARIDDPEIDGQDQSFEIVDQTPAQQKESSEKTDDRSMDSDGCVKQTLEERFNYFEAEAYRLIDNLDTYKLTDRNRLNETKQQVQKIEERVRADKRIVHDTMSIYHHQLDGVRKQFEDTQASLSKLRLEFRKQKKVTTRLLKQIASLNEFVWNSAGSVLDFTGDQRNPDSQQNNGRFSKRQRNFQKRQSSAGPLNRRKGRGQKQAQLAKPKYQNGWPRAPAHTYRRNNVNDGRHYANDTRFCCHRPHLREGHADANNNGGYSTERDQNFQSNSYSRNRIDTARPSCNSCFPHKMQMDAYGMGVSNNFNARSPDCYFLNVENQGTKSGSTNETCLETNLASAKGTEILYSSTIWVADTGASCHVTNSTLGATPSRNASARLQNLRDSLDASGNKMKTTAIVDILGTICSRNSHKTTNIKMLDCRYGSSKFNLCAVTKMTDNGWTMIGDRTGIYLRKNGHEIHFDIPIRTAEGKLWAVRIDRRSVDNDAHEFTLATPTQMNLLQAHAFCGHNNMRETRKTAEHLGWRITRSPVTRCEACAVGKAKQANLGDGEANPPKNIGELWYIDGMQLKRPKTHKRLYFPSNNCLDLAVEHQTGALLVGWYNTKKAFVPHFCSKFHSLNVNHNKQVRRIRCDDAGENKVLQQEINGPQWKMAVQFEFTAKTPQRNSRVETKLFHLSNKTRAALEAANVPNEYRYLLFTLFYKWCAQTDMLTVVNVNNQSKTRHEHLTGSLPNWAQHMQIAGMAGVVKTHKIGTPKVDARGKTCLFACYATDHAKDCYVMFDPITRSTLHSRDVLWLNRMYFPSRTTPGAPVYLTGPRPVIHLADEGSVIEIISSADEDEETNEPVEPQVPNDEGSEPNAEHQLGDGMNVEYPEEEIRFADTDESDQDDDDEESEPEMEDPIDPIRIGRTTRSGRVTRHKLNHDGTPRTAFPTTETAEIVAAAIEERFAEEIYKLGGQEADSIDPITIYDDMAEEERILLTMTKDEDIYTSIEHAFGYIDPETNKHQLVAAALTRHDGELFLVGATGHNYGNTAELKVMTYEEAMQTVDKKEWDKAIEVEHGKMVKYNVFKVVHRDEVPPGTKLFDSTWAMKKKPDGTFRARNAIRGFMQIDGKHYDSHDKSSPVATEVGIKIIFVLTIQANWYQHLVDVEGAFLNGEFSEQHKIYMKVPDAFKQWYPPWAVFLLLKTQYGTVQAALQYYRECCKALAFLGFKRNQAEPCMFYKWENNQMVVFVLWVDDCCISGPKELVLKTAKEFMGLWDCKDLGELKEYVGCQVDRTSEWIRLTQPVKVQRFMDEFGCTGDNGPSNRAPSTPAEPGSVLEYDQNKPLNHKKQTDYRSGVGILLHMMRWSRPDILNAVRELSSHMQKASKNCLKALNRVMNYVVSTKEKGYTFKPNNPGSWDGRKDTKEFIVSGKCDSEYAKHSSRKSVNGGITYLEGAIVKQFSKMMPIVALSTTEAELYSAVLTAQDMMFVYHVMKNMELKVKLPMILYCDNKGAVDLANNWSVGGRTRHMDVKQNYLRELKAHGFLRVEWRTGTDMTPDMHTKNVTKQLFDRYSAELVS